MDIVMHPIGVIRSPFATKDQCPIQGVTFQDAEGRVEVLAEHAEGLKDIEGFSHLFLIYHLDRAGEVQYVRKTFLDDAAHGIYASRHPCRPNSIGMSVVRLASREGSVLHIVGVDVLDNTPLLDIKPYVPKFDLVAEATGGWTEGVANRPKPAGRE